MAGTVRRRGDAGRRLLVPQMYNAQRFRCDVGPYPTLRAICAHLQSLPAFARAAPQAQPDAPPQPPLPGIARGGR